MTASVVIAEASHIAVLADGMRAADRAEAWAWARLGPAAALERSLSASPMAWTGMLDGAPVCMFGVAAQTVLAKVGAPWLLATAAVERVPATFARMSRTCLGWMLSYPILRNWSDARHTRAHAWLRWLGFSLGKPRPMGPLGLPFRPFWLLR